MAGSRRARPLDLWRAYAHNGGVPRPTAQETFEAYAERITGCGDPTFVALVDLGIDEAPGLSLGQYRDRVAGLASAVRWTAAALSGVCAEAPARSCRDCGCADADCSQCAARTGKPCCWVERDLCSACVPANSSERTRKKAP